MIFICPSLELIAVIRVISGDFRSIKGKFATNYTNDHEFQRFNTDDFVNHCIRFQLMLYGPFRLKVDDAPRTSTQNCFFDALPENQSTPGKYIRLPFPTLYHTMKGQTPLPDHRV